MAFSTFAMLCNHHLYFQTIFIPYYGVNVCVPANSYVEALTPQCDCCLDMGPLLC